MKNRNQALISGSVQLLFSVIWGFCLYRGFLFFLSTRAESNCDSQRKCRTRLHLQQAYFVLLHVQLLDRNCIDLVFEPDAPLLFVVAHRR